MRKNNKKKKAFTLIELVIVLAVLAIIALIAIPNFTKVRQDSLEKADIESCNQIKKITLMSIANEDIIPDTTADKTITVTIGETGASLSKDASDVIPQNNTNYQEYLKDVKAPQFNDANVYEVIITPTGEVSVGTDKIDSSSSSK